MVVVADTSPINYLVLIGHIDLLVQLYKRILIPFAVLTELQHPVAPKVVRDWATSAPPWLEVLNPKTSPVLAQLYSMKPIRPDSLFSMPQWVNYERPAFACHQRCSWK